MKHYQSGVEHYRSCEEHYQLGAEHYQLGAEHYRSCGEHYRSFSDVTRARPPAPVRGEVVNGYITEFHGGNAEVHRGFGIENTLGLKLI